MNDNDEGVFIMPRTKARYNLTKLEGDHVRGKV